jgi:hypothetical protein
MDDVRRGRHADVDLTLGAGLRGGVCTPASAITATATSGAKPIQWELDMVGSSFSFVISCGCSLPMRLILLPRRRPAPRFDHSQQRRSVTPSSPSVTIALNILLT